MFCGGVLVVLCICYKFFQIGKLLCLASLLLAVSVAGASPTGMRYGADLHAGLSPEITRGATSTSVNSIFEPVSAELASLGKEFLQLPQNSTASPDLRSTAIRPLPAVPATALMLLSGFLCVSLYKDRKVWLMVLMGILWAGHAGLQTIPRLAHHFDQKHTKKQIYAKQTQSRCLQNFSRLRSDIEGTGYIGLLNYLAGIPVAKSTVNLYISQPAIIFKHDNLALLSHCLAFSASREHSHKYKKLSQDKTGGPRGRLLKINAGEK